MTAILSEAERVLALHHPSQFESTLDAWPESIEVVYAVETSEAWRGRYPSLEDFYRPRAAAPRHPALRCRAPRDRTK